MAKLLMVREGQREKHEDLTPVRTWGHALEIFDKEAMNPFGGGFARDCRQAMMTWHKLPKDMRDLWERELSIDPKHKGKTAFPLKGIIPPQMHIILQHYYPLYLKDEVFLDELFTRFPLWANPNWKPKPMRDKIQRGPSTYAKHVIQIIERANGEREEVKLLDKIRKMPMGELPAN